MKITIKVSVKDFNKLLQELRKYFFDRNIDVIEIKKEEKGLF